MRVSLLHDGAKLSLDFRGLGAHAVQSLQVGQSCSQTPQLRHHRFRRDIAHQRILRERAAPEAAHRHIEAAASGTPGGGDLFRGGIGARVQMDADLDPLIERAEHGRHHFADLGRRRQAHRIGERDLRHARVGEQVAGGDDLVSAPWIALGITESHGNVRDQAETRLKRGLTHRFERIERVFGRLVLVAPQEFRRDGVGEAQS